MVSAAGRRAWLCGGALVLATGCAPARPEHRAALRLDSASALCSLNGKLVTVSLMISNIGQDTFQLEVIASSAQHARVAVELPNGRLRNPRFLIAPGEHLTIGGDMRLVLGGMSHPPAPGDTIALQVRLGDGLVADLSIPVVGVDSLLFEAPSPETRVKESTA